MTDTNFLYSILSDHKVHSLREILSRSFAERGVGLTVHSRASDLRKRGHVVTVFQQRGATFRSRPDYFYRLHASSAALALPGGDHSASPSGAEAAASAALEARSTATPQESAAPVSVSLSSEDVAMTPATAAADLPETRPLSLFDVPDRPAWA